MPDLDDTIAAIATATGAAGLAVVRVSGPRALAVADAVFAGAAPLAGAAGNTLHHGWALAPASAGDPSASPAARARLDEVVAAVFRAPHSYTRQDVVELSCHGGPLPGGARAGGAARRRARGWPVRASSRCARSSTAGSTWCRPRRSPTWSAPRPTAALDLALAQLGGALSRRLDALAGAVSDALAEVEARVDFAEDVGGVEVPAHVVAAVAAAGAEIGGLLAGAEYARAVREGVAVVLAGRPNVGKSSLFNALLGERRAIVTAAPGTTRDLVSETLEIAGVRVTLTDSAGLRRGGDDAESEGVRRARGRARRGRDRRSGWWTPPSRSPTRTAGSPGAWAGGACSSPSTSATCRRWWRRTRRRPCSPRRPAR